jgi:hypothetical protein
MYKQCITVLLLALGIATMLVANAFGYHTNYRTGGTNQTKGVRSLYTSTGTGKIPTTMIVHIESQDGLLQCINQGENPPSQTVAVQTPVPLEGDGSAPGQAAKGNTSSYNVITAFDGTAATDAECDASPECNQLRQLCNSHTWVPVDFVPVTFCGTFRVFECTSAGNCPCDPTGANGPLCLDHDPKTPGIIDPLTFTKEFCTIQGDPDNFQFGEIRQYDCVPATQQTCPGLFP